MEEQSAEEFSLKLLTLLRFFMEQRGRKKADSLSIRLLTIC